MAAPPWYLPTRANPNHVPKGPKGGQFAKKVGAALPAGMAFEGAWDEHPEAKRQVADAINALAGDYDLPTQRVVLRDGEEFGQMAGKSNTSLYFSPRFADDATFAPWAKEMGPYLVGVKRSDVVNHEVGHVLDGPPMSDKDRGAWDALHAWAEEPVTYKVGGKDVTAPRWQAGDLVSQPSTYAQESQYEFIAECFSDWRLNGERAHPSSVEVGRRMDAVLKKGT